jgi:hypothetical protein
MGTLRDLAARLRAADEARHAAEPQAEGKAPPSADDTAELAYEAAAIQATREAEAAGAYPVLPEAEHRAALGGLMRAALMRPPSWPNATYRPTPGAWCGCCGRNPPAEGGRWWQEAEAPKGWRCATCYPPPSHLAGNGVCEVMT